MRAFHEKRIYNSGLPVQISKVRSMNFLAHWHHDLEFVYVTEGSLQVGINSETRTLKAGEFAFCGSGDIHYYDSGKTESEILLVVFNPRLIGSPAGWPEERGTRSPFIPYRGSGTPSSLERETLGELAEVFERIEKEGEGRREQSETVMIGLLHMLCGLALRCASPAEAEPRRSMRSVSHLKTMQELLEYLEQHCALPLTLQDGANRARMSVFHFSRFFKNVTGMNYNTYLNELRVRRAEELIVGTDNRLLDIALDCGFGNVRTFNRVFRQLRGCTPSELR
ncbi:AraC family transcriptional regulator [Saccharibacillus alkalitolerans]|uniref:Helix-turn-helix transcriptional regulator n=1 Tax=Saccharibacillus alkalitolerans TaxID=2705290 RepID=A0ABX0F9Y6_9BACL|nr:AraC family transcriptional regulator [Saccharibacillus alkalitolerans]NGZ77240.1 helix-turn-helix transcriptional regulator [Saccharibacillus alkalitolerans]